MCAFKAVLSALAWLVCSTLGRTASPAPSFAQLPKVFFARLRLCGLCPVQLSRPVGALLVQIMFGQSHGWDLVGMHSCGAQFQCLLLQNTPTLRYGERCGRGGRKTVRARGLGSLLWDFYFLLDLIGSCKFSGDNFYNWASIDIHLSPSFVSTLQFQKF